MRPSPRSAISRWSAEEAGKLREAIAAAAGEPRAGRQGAARQDRRPGGPQARQLVPAPWRIWHGGRDSRLPGCQSGLARPRPADPARRGSAVQRQRRPARHQGLLRQRRAPHRHRPWPARLGPSGREGRGQGQGAGAEGLDRSRHAGRPSSRASSGWSAPCSPRPTTSAASTACLQSDTRWTGERNERAAVIRRTIALLSEEEKKKAEARLAVFLRAKNSQKLISKLPAHSPGRLGPRRAKGPGVAPPEEGGGGLEDPAGGAGRRRCRQAGRLVGGAPRQRLRGAQARQAEDGLRARAQSGHAVGQCRQGRLVPGRLAGAAPPQGRQAGARPFRGAGQGCRRAAEPRAGPILARPHPRNARRQGQGPGALSRRIGLFRHLPRPARAPEARSRRAPPRDHAAGRADRRRKSPASTAPMRSGPPC